MDKLNLTGNCVGQGHWSDPEQEAAVPLDLTEHAEQFYDDRADLSAVTSGDISFRNLDLLFIDLDQIADDSAADLDLWLSQLKADATLILHGTRDLARPSESRLLLTHRIGQMRQIRMGMGRGLTVLPLGKLTPRMQTLIDNCTDGAVPANIERIFQRLGQGLVATAENKRLGGSLTKAKATLGDQKSRLESLREELEEIRRNYSDRNRYASDLQAKLFDLNAAIESARTDKEAALAQARSEATAALDAERRAASAKFSEASDDFQKKIDAAIRERDDALAAVQAERDTRFAETAALTRMVEDYRKKIDAAIRERDDALAAVQAEREARFAETAALTRILEDHRKRADRPDTLARHEDAKREIKKLKARAVAAEKAAAEILSSTSWRITKPMRSLKDTFRRRPTRKKK
ncbi:MAG: hypothetical protein P3W90_004325 [Paracoccus sp. (in: a-proteobacteria)]|nr:hypothetical protein [Paracoccus sp. (in: a-proteobacteria)]